MNKHRKGCQCRECNKRFRQALSRHNSGYATSDDLSWIALSHLYITNGVLNSADTHSSSHDSYDTSSSSSSSSDYSSSSYDSGSSFDSSF